MFILKGKEQLEKAIAKAMKTRCQVKFISFGIYRVSGSQGSFYTVRCEKVGNENQVSCSCKAGQSVKRLVCYHSVSALALHTALARQRQTA